MQSYTSGSSGLLANTARISENVVDRCSSLWSPSRSPNANVMMNLNCASVGVNAVWRFNRLFSSFRQSCASCSFGDEHSRSSAMIRLANAPVEESNAASFMVDSCARHRTASGGIEPRREDSALTARGTTPSRIDSRFSPSALPPPPTPFSPDILRSSALRSPRANVTSKSKLGGTSSSLRALAMTAATPTFFPPCALCFSGASSSESGPPYFAFLYLSPASGPLSSLMYLSEPAAGSLMRYHPLSQTRLPVSFSPLRLAPSWLSSR
mmetsp:Transcript_7173/g.32382  ORF Transcript_7173/g.32382 Transcript_7173/m.32382 type:complete len:267 (+) Transcript_7173:962-1762(+)